MTIKLWPLNDLTTIVALQNVAVVAGQSAKMVPDLTGPVSAFLALSILPTATVAEASLVATVTHVGKGNWLIHFDATILLPALLASLFANAVPYIIIVQTNGTRSYVPLVYEASRLATVVV